MNYYNKDVYNELYWLNKITYFDDWYKIVKPILLNDEFQRRKLFVHHENSVWEHSINVSFKSFLLAKFYHLNERRAAIAGLLHDFYPYAWQSSPELEKIDKNYLTRYYRNSKKFSDLHGFVHAKEAAINAKKYFPELVDEAILSCIKTHMFPLNIKPPRYPEGWIITFMDKKLSLNILKDVKKLPKYVGIHFGS